MVSVILATMVAAMSLFYSGVSSSDSPSASSSTPTQISDYAANVQGPTSIAPNGGKESNAVPEPATMALIAPLLTGLWVMKKKV